MGKYCIPLQCFVFQARGKKILFSTAKDAFWVGESGPRSAKNERGSPKRAKLPAEGQSIRPCVSHLEEAGESSWQWFPCYSSIICSRARLTDLWVSHLKPSLGFQGQIREGCVIQNKVSVPATLLWIVDCGLYLLTSKRWHKSVPKLCGKFCLMWLCLCSPYVSEFS